MRRLNTEEFTQKAQEKHGVTYDYSKVQYVRSCDKVIIVCNTHGEWVQRPNDHLTGNGCPVCKFDKISTMKRSNADEFTKKSNIVHNNEYQYNEVQYKNAITKVIIKCKTHGAFMITPDKHLNGGGCQKCSHTISRGERRIMHFLDKNNIVYEREKSFDGLCGKTKNSRLKYDFYLQDCNMLLEYDGEHHFYPVRTKGRLTESQAIATHRATKVNDKKKNRYAKKNGYKLIRISYKDYGNIESILSKLF